MPIQVVTYDPNAIAPGIGEISLPNPGGASIGVGASRGAASSVAEPTPQVQVQTVGQSRIALTRAAAARAQALIVGGNGNTADPAPVDDVLGVVKDNLTSVAAGIKDGATGKNSWGLPLGVLLAVWLLSGKPTLGLLAGAGAWAWQDSRAATAKPVAA